MRMIDLAWGAFTAFAWFSHGPHHFERNCKDSHCYADEPDRRAALGARAAVKSAPSFLVRRRNTL
jgi:hypothetical protein